MTISQKSYFLDLVELASSLSPFPRQGLGLTTLQIMSAPSYCEKRMSVRRLPNTVAQALTFLRAGLIVPDHWRRIFFQNHQSRDWSATETDQTSTLGHGRYRALPFCIAVLLQRCSRCHFSIRPLIARFI